MKRELTATPEGPLHLAERLGAGNYSKTLHFIPGTALRGALAAAYLNREDLGRQIDELLQPFEWSFEKYFDWVFLSGLVRFANLYPRQEHTSFVIPLSARSCKLHSGFVAEDVIGREIPHGVFDILLFEPERFRCATDRKNMVCGAPMEPVHGFYQSANGEAQARRRVNARRRVLTRTAIESGTEIVRQGMFYSLESIEEGGGGYAVFSGKLNADAPPDLTSEHQQALMGLLHGHIGSQLSMLSVGAARTRGLGRVRLELSEFDTPELMPLEQRFVQLQEKWRETNPELSGETVFTLTLNSDAIVLDELWRYCSVLDEHVLASEAPGLPACHLGERFFTGTRIVSGWNSAHRLPKEDELAITKGAAFLYKSSADPQALLDWLQTLESQGIGERRSEGFGQIIACHPFHWEVPKK